MRIDKIEIDGFGKLNNFSINLNEGFNLIFGENESGKSTLCDFLLCMFYDMPNDGKRLDLSESLRRKYRPWNNENFGGRVFFNHQGKDYILEKSFGKTKQSDRVKLLDALSWDEVGGAENVGERFFGLGREGFLKTLYITALGEKIKDSGNEELLTKLSNLETGGDEEVSYINIKNALEKEQFSILTKTEKGGKLYTLRERLNQLATERAVTEQALSKYKEDEERAVSLKSEITKLQNGIKDAEKVQKIAIEHESFIAEKQRAETRKIISDRIKSEFSKLSELKENKEKISEELSKKINSEDVDNAKILEKQLVIFENKELEAREKLESFKDAKKAKKLTAKILVSAVFVVLVFVLSFFVFDILTSSVVGVASAGLSALIIYLSSKKDGRNDMAQAENELLKAQENLSKTNEEIDALCQKYGQENLNSFFDLAASEKERGESLVIIETQIEKSEAELEVLKKNEAEISVSENKVFSEEAIAYSGEKAEVIARKTNELKIKHDTLNEEYYTLTLSLARQTGSKRDISEIESEMLILKTEIEELEKRHKALKKASEWLEKAHNEIKQNFAPRLNQKITEIFSRLTISKYDGVRAGENFNLNYKNERNEIVEASFLSGGTNDLLYIALKLATLSVLFGENTAPVILDDAFLQVDDKRLSVAVDFLAESKEISQIIYFTCHKSMVGLFDNEKINKIEL